jgi:hypothetical protein
MHVVGHQHIGLDGTPVVYGRGGEPVAVTAIVVLTEEDGLAVIAALDHVLRLIGQEIKAKPCQAVSPRRK